jgi:tetratricopeptide (TPR) repeat protein
MRTAQVLGNLGGVYLALHDKEQAMIAYREAADIFLELGEKQHYSDTLLALGNLQIRDGKFISGAVLYQLGLEEKENLNMRQRVMKHLSNIIAGFNSQMTA